MANTIYDQYNQRNNAMSAALGLSSTTPGAANAYSGSSLNNDYAVGNRVYGAGSPSPQAGAGSVNPAGYATRDNSNNARRQAIFGLAQKGY